VEGRIFSVPSSDISFAQSKNTFFYRVKKGNIKVVEEAPVEHVTIYEDEDELDCIICMDGPKAIVFIPCGHYSVCKVCSSKLENKCPICRSKIKTAVDRDKITN